MALITDTALYKSRQQITLDMLATLQSSVADAYIGTDGIIYILFTIEAGQMENVLLANQILLQDCFPQTASAAALALHGQMFGIPQKQGTYASGPVFFYGDDGIYVPMGTEVGAARSYGLDPLTFTTMAGITIPAPGIPTALTAAAGAAGPLTGSYDYVVTFVTNSGETLVGATSNAATVSGQNVNLSNIPIGGPGTTTRRIYRRKNGTGLFQLAWGIPNNTATTQTDNQLDSTVAASTTPPTVDTSHGAVVNVMALQKGEASNVAAGTVTLLVNVPPGITSAVNPNAFDGGTDPESTEEYRTRLLIEIADPQTGSVDDLVAWSKTVEGVDSATVFENDNMGSPLNGHVTVRIAGPNGAIPDADTIASVQSLLDSWDIANITVHVTTFTAKVQAVTVDVTLDATHVLSDVTATVQQAITDYINSVPVGGVLYVAGIIDAVYGLPGILDVVMTSPTTNQTTTSTQKFTPGTISVT